MVEEVKTTAEAASASDNEELPSVEEEFRTLYEGVEDIMKRVNAYAKKLQNSGSEPVTKADLAQLYLTLSGDVLSLMKDHVAADGAAFNDLFEIVDTGDDDDSEEDEESSDDAFKVFATLKQNIAVFTQMMSAPGVTAEAKQGLENQVQLNTEALNVISSQYTGFEEAWDKLQQDAIAAAETAKNGQSTQAEAQASG